MSQRFKFYIRRNVQELFPVGGFLSNQRRQSEADSYHVSASVSPDEVQKYFIIIDKILSSELQHNSALTLLVLL